MSAGPMTPVTSAPAAASGGGAASSAPLAAATAASFADDSSSLSSMLQSGLTALYKHSSRRHEALRQQCVEVLSKIKAEEKARQDRMAKGDANKYFLPLKLACDTGQAKLVALALDSMEKLVAYGYLDGNAPAPEDIYPSKKKPETAAASTAAPTPAAPASGKDGAVSTDGTTAASSAASSSSDPSKRKLIHVMLETLYECSMYKDPLCQRQVLKALLTVVSSVACPVHDHCLLQSVTAAYQIYLQAGDETNRTTSRAALTQIFNIVFQRMEHFAAQLKELDEAARQQREADKQQSIKLNEGIPTASPRDEEAEAGAGAEGGASAPAEGDAGSAATSTSDAPAGASTTEESDAHGVGLGQLDIDTESQAQPVEPTLTGSEFDGSGEGSSAPTPVASGNVSVNRSSPSLTPRPSPGLRGYCVACGKPANHLCLQTRDSVCGMECKLANLTKKDPNRKQALSVRSRIANKLQVLQNDAYYLLRALIKLSHKALSQSPPEQAAVDSKLLSLTLLLSVMSNAGPTFRSSRTFISLVKVDLVNCLLRNSAASQIDSIFTLSSQIFVATMRAFKPHLHRSIGPMLDSIYLPYIQSPNSSFQHKQASMQVIKDICHDKQLLIDLFLNYDCDLSSFNTFQKIAEVLEKIAHAPVLAEDGTPLPTHSSTLTTDSGTLSDTEEARLKLMALEALVGAMGSLAEWTTRIVKPNAQAMAEQIQHAEGENLSGAGRTTALAAIGAAVAAAAMKSANADDARPSAAGDEQPLPSPSPPPHSSSTTAAAPPALSTGAHLANSFSTQFQFLRAQKQKLDTGIAKFNAKPKVGLAYLQSHGLLGEDAESVARFFHSHPSLDKVQLGDFMGDEHAFNKAVLYAYVDSMDFKGQVFDESIREFVQGFRLPGEAQKIDRMMEKFAERYHKDNPGRFHSADTAYVLAYSIIMLNTDAHNPGVKVRMSKDDFIKNCRGIDDGKDVDPKFMGDIYDRITQNEIKMKDDPLTAGTGSGAAASDKAKSQAAALAAAQNNPKKRFSAFVKESQQMVRRTQELIKTKVPLPPGVGGGGGSGGAGGPGQNGAAAPSSGQTRPRLSTNEQRFLQEVSQDQLDQPDTAAPTPSNAASSSSSSSSASAPSSSSTDGGSNNGAARPPLPQSLPPQTEKSFYEATDADAEAIRPMFEILCFPSLATFSVLLEENEADQVVRLCLGGYRSAIRIATALELQTARLAFISSLQRFTHLGSGKAMRRKHIDAIATILALGSTPAEGNHLKQNWVEVLHTISEVERMQLIANNTMRGREGTFAQELVSGAPVTSMGGGMPLGSNNAAAAASVLNSTGGRMNLSGGGGLGVTGGGGVGVAPGGIASTDTLNSLQVQLLDPALIDRVFACSALLDGEAIVDFVQALRSVSEAELSNPLAPRVFSLQKMVEVTRANMGRVRIVWSRIWSLLAAFFQKAGCHPHIHVSMYAIDSLRQLAMKFLEKDELSSYQFQKHFFRPFEFIMIHNPNGEIRELVLQCIDRMIDANKVENIKSGWKGIFLVLTVAANSDNNSSSSGAVATTTSSSTRGAPSTQQPNLVVQAFAILSNIMDNYFSLLAAPDAAGAEGVEECVNCLVTFGCQTKHQDISAKAIQYLTNCASTLSQAEAQAPPTNSAAAGGTTSPGVNADGAAAPSATSTDGAAADAAAATPLSPPRPSSVVRKLSIPSTPSSPSSSRAASSASGPPPHQALKTWFLVLTGLSRMISDPRLEVRSLALETLFLILGTHGAIFTSQTWRTVFHGVLFPIFDDVRYAGEINRPTHNGALGASPSPEPVQSASMRLQTEEGDGSAVSSSSTTGEAVPSPSSRRSSQEQRLPPTHLQTRSSSSHQLNQQQQQQQQMGTPSSGASTPVHAARQSPSTPAAAPNSAPRHSLSRSRSGSTLHPSSAAFDNSWLQTTCFTALSSLIDLFVRFHSSVHFLLPELLRLLQGCIVQSHAEPLAKIGVRCLSVLLHKLGGELSVGEWWVVIKAVDSILADVLPRELVEPKLRVALMLPPAQGPTPVAYASLVRDKAMEQQANGEASAASSSSTADGSTDAARPTPASVPAPHTRSASTATPLPSAPYLPFSLSPMQTRLKVQLWLLESLFQSVMKFFPRVDMRVHKVREQLDEEQHPTPRTEPRELNMHGSSSDDADASDEQRSGSSGIGVRGGPLVDVNDGRVLGCLTPVQALYAADLLGVVLNTAHAFNADITLRRKLHSVGFFVPAPNHTAGAAAAPATPGQPQQSSSQYNVPASPAPVGQMASSPSFGTAAPSTPISAPQPAAAKPARLPQLFYHEAHTLRLCMDILFRLVGVGHTGSQQQQHQHQLGGGNALWLSEMSRLSAPHPGSTPTTFASSPRSAAALPGVVSLAEARLIHLCESVMSEYVTKTQAGQLVSLEFHDEILVGLIHNVAAFPPHLFLQCLPRFYTPLCELIEYAAVPTIRHAIRALFANNIATLLQQQGIPLPLPANKHSATAAAATINNVQP